MGVGHDPSEKPSSLARTRTFSMSKSRQVRKEFSVKVTFVQSVILIALIGFSIYNHMKISMLNERLQLALTANHPIERDEVDSIGKSISLINDRLEKIESDKIEVLEKSISLTNGRVTEIKERFTNAMTTILPIIEEHVKAITDLRQNQKNTETWNSNTSAGSRRAANGQTGLGRRGGASNTGRLGPVVTIDEFRLDKAKFLGKTIVMNGRILTIEDDIEHNRLSLSLSDHYMDLDYLVTNNSIKMRMRNSQIKERESIYLKGIIKKYSNSSSVYMDVQDFESIKE